MNDASNIDSVHDSNGIYCFIHSCSLKNNDILDEIVDKINKMEFHHIFIINIGNKINKVYGENVDIIEYSENINLFEIPTINIIHSFCVRNPESKVLYLHTKGVSYQTVPQQVVDWKNMMLYFLIDNDCVKLLEKHDIVGCNYLENPHPHFSGNFWWARASYVNKLKPIETTVKHDAEWWIFSDNNPSYYSLHNSNVNHYHELYPLDRYKENKIRIKMLCNWCSSKDLCNEWSNMCKRGYIWKNIEITWDDCNIDYWVIINKPCDNSYYDPKRTIVFQMEPWVNNESHLWGVKTWGSWAEPDENKFLAVRGRKTKCHNNAFWQLELNYNELIDLKYENENKLDAVSSICSSKYYDEGHIARIDFLKFLETKGGIPLDVFNQDNQHKFKTYRGPLTPYVDKSKGIAPYKYYFMVENNYEENFITEKIWEPILCETLVFYYGCPNVCDYINPEAFVQLDMNDFEKSYQIIKQAIEEDWWSQRIEAIRREKKKILNELAFFPVIENIITNVKGLLIVFAVYSSSEEVSKCIIECKNKIMEVYPYCRIVYIDNNSTNKNWKQKDMHVIMNDDVYGYEIGAYRKALQYYRADKYLFLQGTVFINKKIEYELKEHSLDIKMLQSFKMYNGVMEYKKYIDEIMNYQNIKELNLDVHNCQNVNCVFGNNFYCNNFFVEEMLKDGLFNIICYDKQYSCSFERILGLYIYKKLGDVLPIDDCHHASTIQYNTLPYNYDYVMCKIWCSQK
jgi:hypothetical protein